MAGLLGLPNADDLKKVITDAGGTLTAEAEAALEKALDAASADVTEKIVPALKGALVEVLAPAMNALDRAVALAERLEGAALKLELGPPRT